MPIVLFYSTKTWFRQPSLEHLRWVFICSAGVVGHGKTCLGQCSGRSRWVEFQQRGTLSTGFCWLRVEPTNGSIFGTLLRLRGGDVASNATKNSRLVRSEVATISWIDNRQVVGKLHTRRSSWVFLLLVSHYTIRVVGAVYIQEEKFPRRRTNILDPWIDPGTTRN